MKRLIRALAAMVMLVPLGFASAAHAAGCLPGGTDADIQAGLNAPAAVVVLCQGAVFTLNNRVGYTAVNQRITTEGQPTDDRRALLRLGNGSLTGAVTMEGVSGAVLEHVRVDGMAREFGNRRGAAMIGLGGNASDQVVRFVHAYNTSGWPVLHMFEGTIVNSTPGCQRASVTNNTIGPTFAVGAFGSDGIMVACGNSLVQNNLVIDATDVGIVIFGAPGTLVQGNHVLAATQELPNGIAMADYFPMNGNYANTRVDGNIVEARGAFIRVGMPIGPRTYGFCDGNLINRGGSVTNNWLRGQYMGYGIAVAGVSNFVISGNVDESRHIGRTTAGGCGGGIPPQPYLVPGFIYHPSSTGGSFLQPGFAGTNAQDLTLHTTVSPILMLPPSPPTDCGVLRPGQWLGGDFREHRSCDGRFLLSMQGDGNLVLYAPGFVPLWSSRTRFGAMAIMQSDGNFVMYEASGLAPVSSGTVIPGSWLAIQNDGNVVVYAPWGQPLWATNTCCH